MKRKAIVIALWILCVVIIGGCGTVACQYDSSSIIDKIEDTYNLEIRCEKFASSTWDVVSCDGLTEGDKLRLEEYLKMFDREFGKYPPEFVARTGLRRIYLCKNLRIGEQYRAAMPDYFTETLYYDIYRGCESPGYLEDVLHHEYYHMIEQELNGDAYYKDPKWVGLKR